MMLAFAATLIPQCGFAGLATALPFLIMSTLYNARIVLDWRKILGSLPSPMKVQSVVTEQAVDTMLLAKASAESNPNIYTSVDKCNKKGNKNLAKFLC